MKEYRIVTGGRKEYPSLFYVQRKTIFGLWKDVSPHAFENEAVEALEKIVNPPALKIVQERVRYDCGCVDLCYCR
jgi:hypothetical protein